MDNIRSLRSYLVVCSEGVVIRLDFIPNSFEWHTGLILSQSNKLTLQCYVLV